MSENLKKTGEEDISALVEAYAKLEYEYSKNQMKKEYPHIDFDNPIARADPKPIQESAASLPVIKQGAYITGSAGELQYKTIAAPVGLIAESGQDYENAVKKYAAIIDAEAVGGWELHWIQQIPVMKITRNIGGILGFFAIAAVLGFALGAMGGGRNYMVNAMTYAVIGGFIGAGIGYAACKNKVVEFFNMLIFKKRN